MPKKGEPLSEETKAKMRASQEARRNRLREAPTQVAQAGEAAAALYDKYSGEMVAEGGFTEPPDDPVAIIDEKPPTEFEVFVSRLDDATRSMLSTDELMSIFAAGQAERKAQQKKEALERARLHARITSGVLPPEDAAAAKLREYLAEPVSFTVVLPETCYMEALGCVALVVDSKTYRDGQTYTEPRAVYLSVREQCYRAQQGELDFEGRSRLHHMRRERFGSTQLRLA